MLAGSGAEFVEWSGGMVVRILLTILIGALVLTLYVQFEKRRYQQSCRECGAKISADEDEGKCANCRLLVD